MHPSLAALQQIKFSKELDFLAYDIQNATQPLALKPCVERLFNIVAHLVFLVVDEAQLTAQPSPPLRAPQPVPPTLPAQPPVAPAPTVYPPGYHVTPNYQNHLVSPPTLPPVITQPVPLVNPGLPTPEIGPSDKMNVVITPTGVTVIPPTGATPVTLPPYSPVDLPGLSAPAVPPPAPPGVMNVVLPRGGVMPDEVAQAVQSTPQIVPVSRGDVTPPR